MGLPQLELKSSYDSEEDVLNSFYIPVLSQVTTYHRLAGFFSSTALAVAARGMSNFIKNNGKMKLVVGAKLHKDDVEAIRQGLEEPEKLIEKISLQELYAINNELINDHVSALGWMVANKTLEIKVAILTDETGVPLDADTIERRGIFHQKVGILQDKDGNSISFSGSINETATAWLHNIEEFKVFRSWIEGETEYLQSDYRKFEKYWNGSGRNVKVMNIPEAVKEKLIEIAPKDITELNLDKWQIKEGSAKTKRRIILLDYQNQAILNWLNNNKKGIFEMATGTGKTFTALGCLKNILKTEEKLITVITCPYDHLVKQWQDNIKDFDIVSDIIIADSSNPNWKNKLADYVIDIKNDLKEKLIILTTHATFSSEDFINIIKIPNEKLFLIADEVHGVGAPKRQVGLIENYDYRLGLSATPKRWFDLEGTSKLFEYFGGTVFEFSLKDAINTINPATGLTYLTPYEYKPYFIELTDEELLNYQEETKKIAKLYGQAKNNKEKEELVSLLAIKRQKIIKNASNKYPILNKILNTLDRIEDCLIYCLPEQIDKVQEILMKKDIRQHKFTLQEGTKPDEKYGSISEREFLLKKFAEGTYQALVAIKCLDEGIDVPPARIAIILASSGNPREYIQRAGRVLRRYPGKEKAIIYDIIVIPTLSSSINSDFLELEKKIIEKEIRRYKEFAYNAINKLECLDSIGKIEEKYRIFVSIGG